MKRCCVRVAVRRQIGFGHDVIKDAPARKVWSRVHAIIDARRLGWSVFVAHFVWSGFIHHGIYNSTGRLMRDTQAKSKHTLETTGRFYRCFPIVEMAGAKAKRKMGVKNERLILTFSKSSLATVVHSRGTPNDQSDLPSG